MVVPGIDISEKYGPTCVGVTQIDGTRNGIEIKHGYKWRVDGHSFELDFAIFKDGKISFAIDVYRGQREVGPERKECLAKHKITHLEVSALKINKECKDRAAVGDNATDVFIPFDRTQCNVCKQRVESEMTGRSFNRKRSIRVEAQMTNFTELEADKYLEGTLFVPYKYRNATHPPPFVQVYMGSLCLKTTSPAAIHKAISLHECKVFVKLLDVKTEHFNGRSQPVMWVNDVTTLKEDIKDLEDMAEAAKAAARASKAAKVAAAAAAAATALDDDWAKTGITDDMINDMAVETCIV